MVWKQKLRNLLTNHQLAVSIILLLVLLAILFLIFNEPPHAAVVHSSNDLSKNSSGFNETPQFWVKTTKTTGGLPFLKNDIYNTMGLEVLTKYNRSGIYVNDSQIGYWVGAGQWRFFFDVTSIASSRSKDTDKNSTTIKSQTLTVIYPQVKTYKDLDYSVAGIIGISSDAFQSWPWKNPSPGYSDEIYGRNWSILNSEVIAEMNNYTQFPLSSTEYSQSLGRNWISHYGWSPKTPDILLKVDFPYSEGWDGKNSYSQGWNNGISDCGYTYYIDYFMSAGTTHEFDIITTTDWGLYDSSKVNLHVKITAPPSPTGMSESQLNKYGIVPEKNEYGEIIQYSIDPGNLSIEVT